LIVAIKVIPKIAIFAAYLSRSTSDELDGIATLKRAVL